MTLFLRDFTFLSEEAESGVYRSEKRRCWNSYYPLGFLPRKGVGRIEFAPITVFYGGNGSGKSTMLNIIAAKLGLLREIPFKPSPFFDLYVRAASFNSAYDSSPLDGARGIPAESRILTSEDVFDKTLTIRQKNLEIDRDREEISRRWWEYRIEGKRVNYPGAEGPEHEAWRAQRLMRNKTMSAVIRQELGYNEKTGSNGENAFDFFLEKIRAGALYLLDEPENSLSAKWQKKLAVLLEGMARFENCQFVIATHSPFLLGLRGIQIHDLDTDGCSIRKWTELENVREYFDLFKSREEEFR